MTLFEDIKRQDFNSVLVEPQRNVRNNDSSFNYLNCYDSPEIIRIRNLLESSFIRFPLEAQKRVRGDFRSSDNHQHDGAFFELFLHALLTRLGCTIEVEPRITGADSRPDFLVRHGNQCCYLEATMVGQKSGPFTRNRNEQDVIDTLKTLRSPDFDIGIDMEGTLSRTLRKEDVVRPFEKLLIQHNPDEVQHLIDKEGSDAAPSRKIEDGNWSLQGWLHPISLANRRSAQSRKIDIYPHRAKWTNSVIPVQDALKDKAKKYGELTEPLIVAVSTRDMFYNGSDNDMEVLFGQEQYALFRGTAHSPPLRQRKQNGVWPSYNQVVAIWSFQKVDMWNLSQVSASLYVNPWKNDAVLPNALYRLPYAKGCDGEMKWFAGEDIAQLLDVSRN